MHKTIRVLLNYLMLTLCITSLNIHSYGESHALRNGLIVAGISIAAYCSGYLQKIKRAKGHEVQKATDDISIAIPGTGRWQALSLASQGSLFIFCTLGSVSTLLGISAYRNWLNHPNKSRRQESLSDICLLSSLFYSTTALSYGAKKAADYKIKKFKEEYIQANPETYKEQLCKNRDFVAAQNEVLSF